jgi:DNA-binding transcriptional MocR family regulator
MTSANQPAIGSISVELEVVLEDWRAGGGPRARRLAETLRAAIDQGRLPAGTRLPPERTLAARIGVGRGTVATAYATLARAGLVVRRQGRGTEVAGGDGALGSGRAAELATSLHRNLLFRGLGEGPAEAIDLLASCAPPGAPVRAAIAAALADVDLDELATDQGYHPLGLPPLRRAVAEHLTARGLPTDEDEILVTGGAQQAISLVASSVCRPGQLVVLEDPTFPGAIDAFRTAGTRVLTVPVRDTGADVELLRATLAGSDVTAVYVMPTFQNPTGAVMPEAARRDLARLSHATGVPIVEDDVLAGLALGGDPPPPLAAFDRRAPIISLGSLSKLFWGGLRIGWIRASPAAIAQLGRLKAVSDLGTSLLSQAVAIGLLRDVTRIEDIRRGELDDRLAVLSASLEQQLPDWSWNAPLGGLALWARLPEGSATELAHVARRHGVAIVPGSVMSPTGSHDDFVRLPIDHEPHVLEEGIRRLALAWSSYRTTVRKRAARRLDVVV